jgi:putative oxidoreductase
VIGLVHQLGFLLLGGLFVWAAGVHFLTFRDISSMMAGRGFPASGLLLAAGSVVELVGGLCLILGFGRPYAAAALAVFTIAASVMLLDFWRYSGIERLNLHSAFTANIAIIGGLLLSATADLR